MTVSASITQSGLTITLVLTLADATANLLYVSGSVEWGDGQVSLVAKKSMIGGAVDATLTHVYAPGFYTITVHGQNYRQPVTDHDVAAYPVTVDRLEETQVTQSVLTGQLLAPILPRDSGFPNNSQWALDMGQDLAVIESNFKAGMLTSRGERLADPEFGTSLCQLVFELDSQLVQSIAEEEITQFVSKYVPQVTIESIVIDRDFRNSPREVNVQVALATKNGLTVNTSVGFTAQ